jgi:hypothetical protein
MLLRIVAMLTKLLMRFDPEQLRRIDVADSWVGAKRNPRGRTIDLKERQMARAEVHFQSRLSRSFRALHLACAIC